MYWLIGMMGTGKTTAGRLAAEVLDLSFFDTDEMVSEAAGMKVRELWASQGEGRFREMEKEVIRGLPGAPGVTATGGGAPLDPENAKSISRGESVVWLTCDLYELLDRLSNERERPLLDDERVVRLAHMIDSRKSTYESLATTHIDTSSKTPAAVADELVHLWND